MGRETMSIEKITSKIIADAREQALAIAEDAMKSLQMQRKRQQPF